MTNAIVSASDISKKALLISKKNAIINNVNIDFIYSDMFKNITDKYDVIISNPPYLSLLDCLHASNMVTSKEPINALYAKDNGLFFYKIIVDNASRYLTGEKYLVLEMGDNQCDGVINYVKEKKENIKIDLYQDMQGKNRILVLKY